MPYIGNTIRAADDYRLIDDISSGFNGSETSFALQVAGSAPVPFPKSPQQVLISVNGVIQEPDPTGSSGFNLVGTNIVFSSAPTNGHAFFGIIYATADYLNAGGNFPAGSLGAPSITFIGDENTGLFRKSGGSVGFVSDATEIANFDSNGITISSGSLIIPDSIIHSGDANTKIRFPDTDEISFETGGAERFKITDSESVFNDGSSSYDFRVEGGTEANLLFIDGSADRIGIGTSSPSGARLHLVGDGNTGIKVQVGSSSADQIYLGNTGGASSVGTLTNVGFNLIQNGGAALSVNTSKDIGINTTSPADKLNVSIDTDGEGITISSANLKPMFTGNSNRAAENNTVVGFSGKWNGTEVGRIAVEAGPDTTNKDDGSLTFFTRTSGSGLTKRLSIEENGDVLPGADSTYDIGSNSNRFANGYFDTLYGDGSNLTGVSGTTINNNANDRIITGSGTANTLNGEADLTFDGNTLTHTVGANLHRITSIAAGDHYTLLEFDSNRASAGDSLSFINFKWDGDKVADIFAEAGADTTNKDDGHLVFRTSPSQGSITTRLKIASDGRISQTTGDLVIDNTNNGYGGLRIVDDSGGDYTVNYITGRNQTATAHVFKRGGRVQNQSPWANSGSDAEIARIHRGGVSFGGDTAEVNTLDDYEEGSFSAEIVQGLGSLDNTFDNSATYTKIGNFVHVQALIQFRGTGNGTAVFLKLPFTHVTDTSLGGGLVSFTNVAGLSGESTLSLIGQSAQTYAKIVNKSGNPSISGFQNNQAIYYHFSYQAA